MDPPQAFLQRWGSKIPAKAPVKVARGTGCPRCNQTGYSGRTGILELMILDDELKEMILSNPSVAALREAARAKGMRVLAEDGLEKVLAGQTTIEEVSRVTEQWEESPMPAPEPAPDLSSSSPEKPLRLPKQQSP